MLQFPGVVGHQIPTLRESGTDLARGDLLVLATDGVRSAFIESLSPVDLPDRTAERVLETFGKPIDDALVVAAVFRGDAQ